MLANRQSNMGGMGGNEGDSQRSDKMRVRKKKYMRQK
jgi:hypothetical protein